jgi:hypothetical protein
MKILLFLFLLITVIYFGGFGFNSKVTAPSDLLNNRSEGEKKKKVKVIIDMANYLESKKNNDIIRSDKSIDAENNATSNEFTRELAEQEEDLNHLVMDPDLDMSEINRNDVEDELNEIEMNQALEEEISGN